MDELIAILLIMALSLSGGILLLGFIYAEGEVVEIQFMCAHIYEAPYYDCDYKWMIIMTNSEFTGICNDDPYACMFQDYYMMFIPVSEPRYIDYCGRSIFHHEILHFRFNNESDWFHDEYIDVTELSGQCGLDW